MAVLAEALSVVIKNSSLVHKFIGGTKEFMKTIPNKTYCTDGQLHRVGFMRPQDTEAYIRNLERNGLIFLFGNHCIDIVVIDMLRGPTMPCNWIGFSREKFFAGLKQYQHSDEDYSIVWLLRQRSILGIPLNQNKECEIAVPAKWNPDKAIYGNNFIPAEKVRESLIEIGNEKGLIKYINTITGEFVYVGKPKIKFSDNSNRN